jgi:methionine-rich copper-binding protein CopC
VTIIRRYLLAAVVGVVATVWSAAPAAAAHAELISSSPANGAVLAQAPTTIELTFNEPVTLGANPVYVLGPGGVTWTAQTPTVAGAVVRVPVSPAGPPGEYSVVYEVLSKDQDLVRGVVPFTLSAPATTPPSTAATVATPPPALDEPAPAAEPDAVPVWLWVAGALVVGAVIGSVVTLAIRRRRG